MTIPIIFRNEDGMLLVLFPTQVAVIGPPAKPDAWGCVFTRDNGAYERFNYTWVAYSTRLAMNVTEPIRDWTKDPRCWEAIRDLRQDWVDNSEGLGIEDGSDVAFEVYQRHTGELYEQLQQEARRLRQAARA